MPTKQIIVDSRGRGAHIDVLDHFPIIDVDHHRIHEGHRFTTVDIDHAVATAAPKYWLIRPPKRPLIHFMYSINATYSGTIELFRGPTVTDPGVALLVDNNNQNMTRTATLLVYRDPTITDDGVRIGGQVLGSDGLAANNKGAEGGSRDRKNERPLRCGTDYIVKFTSVLNDTRVSFRIEHYEQVGYGV